MPSRKIPLVNNEFYHILNRGVAQSPIFHNSRDYQRFLKTFLYYQIHGSKPRFSLFTPLARINPDLKIVEVVSYCLMPNHFHFLVKQVVTDGIREFLTKLSNSYAKYFNIKNKRIGPLFQGGFKAIHIETDEQLIHLSRYIHINPIVCYVTKSLEQYSWSSCQEYLGLTSTNFCSKEIILDQFTNVRSYKNFLIDQIDYGRNLEKIKHQLLEEK